MAMIKSNQAEQMMRDVIVLDLGDLRKQADQIRHAAEAEAAQIITTAKQEAARLTSGAESKGYNEGLESGRAEGLEAGRQAGHAEALAQSTQALEQLTEAWNQALHQWDQQRNAMLIEARQSLLRLAVEIAARIVKRVPRIDPKSVAEQLAAAIEHITRPTAITIRIHPADRQITEQALPGLCNTAHQVDHAELVEDDRLMRGGCIVECGQGRIDATLDGQLKRMVEALLPGQMDKQDLQRIVRVDDDDHDFESIDQTIDRIRLEADGNTDDDWDTCDETTTGGQTEPTGDIATTEDTAITGDSAQPDEFTDSEKQRLTDDLASSDAMTPPDETTDDGDDATGGSSS